MKTKHVPEVKKCVFKYFLGIESEWNIAESWTGMSKSDCLEEVNHNLQRELFERRMPSTYNRISFLRDTNTDLLSLLIFLYVSKFPNAELRNKGKIHRY